MLQGMVAQLIRHERVTTTEAKAREVQGLAEKMITKGRVGSLHQRRQALAVLTDKDAVGKLFDEIGPRYSDRHGGYTRITKLSPRQGDSAPMAALELV
jgi:large subunit ribosomal protein L17